MAGSGQKVNFYRPLQVASYVVDYSLWGLNPAGYHLTNILLHVGVAIALFYFLNLLFGSQKISLAASLLYAVHPAHTQAVSYILGRADILCALFLLLGMTA